MLIVESKAGSGIITSYGGDGIFDFGKILLKKALNSGLIKKASRAINSDLGQTVIQGVKAAAQSELGQALKEKAISEVRKRALDVSNQALDKIVVPDSIKRAAQSDLGRQFQKKIVSEVGEKTRILGVPNLAEATFKKLGISEPKRVEPPKKKRRRRKKGKGLTYPPKLLSQFGSGIVLE